jgi:hypothetical protein
MPVDASREKHDAIIPLSDIDIPIIDLIKDEDHP